SNLDRVTLEAMVPRRDPEDEELEKPRTRRVVNGVARFEITLGGGVVRAVPRPVNMLQASGVRGSHRYNDEYSLRYDDRRPERLAEKPNFTLPTTASPCAYFDSTHIAWEPGRPWQAGSYGTIGGTAVTSHHRIFGTPDDALFQTSLEGVEGV